MRISLARIRTVNLLRRDAPKMDSEEGANAPYGFLSYCLAGPFVKAGPEK